MNKGATLNADAKGRVYSPLRALIWKEWRQQRLVFILMTILAYSLALFGLFGEGDMRRLLLRALAGLVGATAILILSANAFAGERDENTERFLEMTPLSRNRIFWVKLSFVFALVLLGLTPLGVWAFSSSAIFEKMAPMDSVEAAFTITLIAGIGLAIMVAVPALIASCGGSVITATLVSIPVVAGCVVWFGYTLRALEPFFPPIQDESYLLLLPVVLIGTLLLAARRLWCMRERTRRSSAITLTVTAGLVISYAVVPMLAMYVYTTCFAPLSFFMDAYHTRVSITGISPTGEYAVFNATHECWGYGKGRAALVDVEAGRLQWITRFYESSYYYDCDEIHPQIWSPSGRHFILREANRPLYKVDARTGAKQRFDDLFPSLTDGIFYSSISAVGWYDDDIVAFQRKRDILFADTKQRTFSCCNRPDASLYTYCYPPWLLPITRHGIFELTNIKEDQLKKEGLCILRYAPELAEAEVLQIALPPIAVTMQPENGYPPLNLIGASQDGEWLLLFSTLDKEDVPKSYYYIARAQNGAKAALLTSDNPNEKGLLAQPWSVKGFLRAEANATGGNEAAEKRSHTILLYRSEPQEPNIASDNEPQFFNNEIAIFNANNGEVHTIMSAPNSPRVRSIELSPKGEFALVDLGFENLTFVLHLSAPWEIVATMKSGWGYRWLGEDHLLFKEDWKLYVINRDGTGKRVLLP